MNRFAAIARKRSRIIVGLMSGTSADGVDAAVVRIAGAGRRTEVETLAHLSRPYPKHVQSGILRLADARAAEIATWNFDLGEAFAEAATAVIAKARLTHRDVDLIGSHGQTIVHVPRRGGRSAVTLQIGEPCVIAERTGIPVVADFRQRDIAAGGEGAPLVPWVDWLLLRPSRGARLAQNLGGVGNVTVITPRAEDVVAFDTGPANAPIDAATSIATRGRRSFDRDGALAAAGRIDDVEVRKVLRHGYFRRRPPKSLDRDEFGRRLVDEIATRRPDMKGEDLVASMTEIVARSVADAYARHVPKGLRIADVVVSGGGVHNATLMSRLRALLDPLPVRSSAEVGIDPDAKEAVAFAVLANETVAGRTSNLPRATGARCAVVLGKLVP